MWPVIQINLGPVPMQIYPYSLLIGCGLCHLLIGVDAAARSRQMDRSEIGRFLYSLGFAAVGGWAFTFLVTPLFYGDKVPWGTVAAMPGILGAAGILLIAARLYRLPLETYLELSVPFFCFTHAWGRLGCFMAGCCHGVPTDSILGVQFPGNSIACKLHGYQPVHPTQLYEMALLVVLGLVAQFLIPLGHRVYSYFLIYGAARFVIELFRGDDRGAIGLIPSLSPSQQLCGIFILAGGILAWRTRTKTQRHAEIGDSSQ